MYSYFSYFRFLGCALVLSAFCGAASAAPETSALQAQEQLLSRASYEQLRPKLEKIRIGDPFSRVLEIAMPKKDNAQYFQVKEMFKKKRTLIFPMWPGVLTPFNTWSYLAIRMNEEKGMAGETKMRAMHFGYLDGNMLRPRKILIFENLKVAKIIDIPDIAEELGKDPGAVTAKVGPLDHFRKAAYERNFLGYKGKIVAGMDYWEVLTLLNASYILTSEAQSFVVMCPGYLNYKGSAKVEKTPEGVRAIYPFGYVKGDREIVKWEVEFLNSRVVDVRAREK